MNDKYDLSTDEIPEKIHKYLHLSYFIVKMLVIGLVLFMAAQLAAVVFLVDDDNDPDGYADEFLGHCYCGTFFVTQTVENTYGSAEAAEQAKARNNTDAGSAEMVIEVILTAVTLICLFLALRCGDKKVIFAHRGSRFFIIAGISYALMNILSEYVLYSSENDLRNYYVGIFADLRYYCQLYNVLAIPFIIFCCGSVLRQHERILHGQSIRGNSITLKATAIGLLIVAFGFMLYRFGVRVYELIMILAGKEISVRLPFYYLFLELPYELAKTSEDHTKLIVFRFVKDLPVFAASAFTVLALSKVLFSAANGKINTAKNRKRIIISIVALIISSLLFNVLGVFEVRLLNSGFTGIYGDVVYTVGIRSFCEPMLYALALWIFLVYIRCVPLSMDDQIGSVIARNFSKQSETETIKRT